jgi:hypothetical protein
MKLIALLGAAALAAAPVPAQASTPSYAKAVAFETCRNQRTGMTSTAAIRKAIDDLWPVYGSDITRDSSTVAARYIVAERIIICGDL